MKVNPKPVINIGFIIAAVVVGVYFSNKYQPGGEFEVLDTRFAFDPKEAAGQLKDLGPERRETYRSFEHGDFWFMGLYAIALVSSIWALAARFGRFWQGVLAAIPALAAIGDVRENFAILAALDGGNTPSLEALEFARKAGIFKFIFFYPALVILLILAVHCALTMQGNKKPYDRTESVERTYLSLRLALTLLVVMLILALAVHAYPPWCLLHSISAYYYTPLQPMFVGTLVAVGICLIVYQGTTYAENVLLDVGGLMAFVVAFVPTTPPDCKTCPGSVVEIEAARSIIVHDNVYPLLIVSLAATAGVLMKRLVEKGWKAGGRNELLRVLTGSGLQALVLLALFVFPEQFENWAHGVAAAALFACIIAVVWSNQLQAHKPNEKLWRKYRYAVVASVMALTLIATVAAHLMYEWPHAIIFVEGGLIVEFAVFWAIQTTDLQGKANHTAQG